MWERVVSRLPPGWSVVAPDLPGAGSSAWLPADEAGVDSYLTDLMAACGLSGRTALVGGYSMGGRVAWHLARRLGDTCRGLLGVSCAPGRSATADQPGREAWLESWARRFAAEDPAAVLADWDAQPVLGGRERAYSDVAERRLRGEALDRLLVAWADHRGTRVTAGAAAPARLLVGAQDATYLARTEGMPGRHIIPGASHAVPWQKPDVVASVLTDLMVGSEQVPSS
jgi:pimeloyl-ACP methyl ester carboxylesterase